METGFGGIGAGAVGRGPTKGRRYKMGCLATEQLREICRGTGQAVEPPFSSGLGATERRGPHATPRPLLLYPAGVAKWQMSMMLHARVNMSGTRLAKRAGNSYSSCNNCRQLSPTDP